MIRQPVGVLDGQPAFERHAPEPDFAWGARRIAGVNNRFAIRCPAHHLHAPCTLIGESLRLTTLRWHHIDFGLPLIFRHKGKPASIG
jgi:hypothetical protein